jgi:prevent-host-death family protein
MQFNVHTAKSQLSKLIEAALNGEEVIIARGNKPVVKLVPVEKSTFKFDVMKDKIGGDPNFFEPLPDDELDLWEGR